MVRRDFNDVRMDQDEIDEFLRVPRYGALATVKSGERPHIDPLGFNYLDGVVGMVEQGSKPAENAIF